MKYQSRNRALNLFCQPSPSACMQTVQVRFPVESNQRLRQVTLAWCSAYLREHKGAGEWRRPTCLPFTFHLFKAAVSDESITFSKPKYLPKFDTGTFITLVPPRVRHWSSDHRHK